MGRFISVLAAVLTCAAIALSADLFRVAGLSLYTEQVLAGLLAIATPLVFLHVSAGGERGRAVAVPWYDAAAAIAGFAASAYLAIRYASLSELTSKQPWDGLLAAGVLLVLFLEGLRRTSGSALFYPTLAFIALAMFGGALPGEFAARSIPLPRLAYYLVWDSSAILGIAIKIIATVVVVYVFFGQVLLKAGGSFFFTGIAMALMGRYRGGPAKIAIVGSSLFGSISGNIVSNVMTVGTDDSPDEARGVPAASRRRDRSLRFDGGPDHASRHGDRRLHHGRVSAGALLRGRPGGGRTCAPFLCRALHPGGPGGGSQRDSADAQGGYPAARRGSQRGLVFPAAARRAGLRPVRTELRNGGGGAWGGRHRSPPGGCLFLS